ncbi:haloacid dehalogenase-like hydrolase family protein [Synechococcus sp. BIOS-U3-1]|uniref:HAD family hydrolase n=1 Tax=Synechococcus sp. BIOS-U3-1 TaxID=1400865 RepID=UPI0018619C45|nr:haloacid dehalogenase-like hydrolase family protein [Synechococcus sp. BIOS-U3-1]
MLTPRLLVFDFDGVIVDGMNEYWWSARHACLRLNPTVDLSESIPPQFRQLRPWIHHGWEMVLIAALISEQRGPLEQLGVQAFVHDYAAHCTAALERFRWNPVLLQQTLEAVRADAVRGDRDAWLALHQPYPGVPERLTAFSEENIAWAVLTTKASDFTSELLASMGLKPERLDGHESGSKPEVLRRLACNWRLDGFVEDRRPTLETVRTTAGLETVPCWLVSWGYLRPTDVTDLPSGIRLLRPEQFATPLADWP